MVDSNGRRDTSRELCRRDLILQGLARPFIQLTDNCAEFCIGMDRQVCGSWPILHDQSIGVVDSDDDVAGTKLGPKVLNGVCDLFGAVNAVHWMHGADGMLVIVRTIAVKLCGDCARLHRTWRHPLIRTPVEAWSWAADFVSPPTACFILA
jgi:hypothetical protein